jgi:hypothetical protein
MLYIYKTEIHDLAVVIVVNIQYTQLIPTHVPHFPHDILLSYYIVVRKVVGSTPDGANGNFSLM